MIKAIVFDVDGVLVDGLRANLEIYNVNLKHLNLPTIPLNIFKKNVHLGTFHMLRLVLKNEEDIKTVATNIKNRFFRYPTELLKFADNLESTLNILSKKYKLAIVSNRSNLDILDHIKDYFQCMITIYDVKNPKPDPEGLVKVMKQLDVKPSQTLYIGDTKYDELTATNAKTLFLHFDITKVKDFNKIVKKIENIDSI